jgi:phospholipid/cholesterol/gamma-HCH transport system substrate-binding protein
MKLPNFNLTTLNTERKTTRFMWVAVAVLVVVSGMIAYRQDYFVRNTSIYFFAPNAQGISKGMAVKFIGFKVGSVQEISMQSNASVKVKLSLDNEYVRLIGQDAKARLTKEALVGEGVVEIIPGEEQVRQVVQNSVLEFERGIDAGALVERLTGQLQPILVDVKQITSAINNPRGDVQQILKNLNQVTGGLRETVVHFNTLAQNGNQKLDGAYVKVDRALDRVNSSLETLDKAIPKLVGKADKTLDNVQSATVDIKRITTESSDQIPALVRNTNALVQDGQETLKGVKKSWLLNDLFPSPEETALPVDGYVAPPPAKP